MNNCQRKQFKMKNKKILTLLLYASAVHAIVLLFFVFGLVCIIQWLNIEEAIVNLLPGIYPEMIWILGLFLIIGLLLFTIIYYLILRAEFHKVSNHVNSIQQIVDEVSCLPQNVNENHERLDSLLHSVLATFDSLNAVVDQNQSEIRTVIAVVNESKSKSSDLDTHFTQVKNLHSQIHETVHKMSLLSDQFTEMIQTIDSVAFQTHLLSLNAAVEAAHAGESGKGFAVVADEVRKLSKKSASSADAITTMLEETQTHKSEFEMLTNRFEESIETCESYTINIEDLTTHIETQLNQMVQQLENSKNDISKTIHSNQDIEHTIGKIYSSQKILFDSLNSFMNIINHISVWLYSKDSVHNVMEIKDIDWSKSIPKKNTHEEPFRLYESKKTQKKPVGAKTLRPQDIIPLDDDDFEDF